MIGHYFKQFSVRLICFCMALAVCGSFANAQKPKEQFCGADCLYVALCGIANKSAPARFSVLLERIGKPDAKGYSLAELKAVAIHYGTFAECMHVDYRTLEELVPSYQVILHLTSGHYVLCRQVGKDAIIAFDPSRGAASISAEKLRTEWQGDCLVVGKSPILLKSGSFILLKPVLVCVGFLSIAVAVFYAMKIISKKKTGFGNFATTLVLIQVSILGLGGCDNASVRITQKDRMAILAMKSENSIDLGIVAPSDTLWNGV